MATDLKASVFIDCVGGELCGQILECLPAKTSVLFFGMLSFQGPAGIDPLKFISSSYTIEGWVLGAWLGTQGTKVPSLFKKCHALMLDPRF